MSRWIDDVSIERKLVWITMLTVGVSLVAACLTFVFTDALATYRSAREELATVADIVANNSVSALAFEDVEVAEETLATLSRNEGIVSGCLYANDREVLARWARAGHDPECRAPQERSSEPILEGAEIVLWHPIVFQDERLGTLLLRSDLSRLQARVIPYVMGTLLAMAVSSLIALALSARLKNVITRPILRLADAVDEVSRSQRYSTRVAGAGDDEVGLLTKGFNEMLELIQVRDVELRKYHDELEQRVVERTAELEIARDAAQAASRAKSEFLANMSHEIRTPLNAVMGLTDILLTTDLDETQSDYLGTVRDSADSLLTVLNDILDFSKIEAGKLDLEKVRFSLHDTVGDTLTSLALRADDKGIELACFVDPKLPAELIGDPGRLRQVLANLVSNAIKFTERGEIVVRVEPESAAGNRMTVRVSVRDTGIGIARGSLARLFEPFEQADTSTTRRFGGTGLGLSISRQLVEMMDGEIGVESREGAGSDFTFTARFEVPADARSWRDSEPLPLDDVRVLIVDDNETNLTILEELTNAKNMKPGLAASADAALRALDAKAGTDEEYQLLLSDVHMPDTDGFGLVERMRDDRRFARLPVVFLTSAGQTGDLERCERLGIAARLVKPVKQSELFQVAARALGGERVMPPAPAEPVVEAAAEPSLPPLRILLVDDSAANRKVAMAMLKRGGHTIETAENGLLALEKLEEQSFDVALMDVQMPEMDGFEATAAIRANEAGSGQHLPIIAMTAHALQGDREKCLAAGMDDYVPKPVRRTRLLHALARVTPSGAEAPAAAAAPDGRDVRPVRWAGVIAQVGDDREVLREIVEAYLSEIRDALETLPGLLATGSSNEARRVAHTLKGSMRTFGAENAARAARELEERVANGDLAGAAEDFARVKAEVDLVVPHLTAFLESGSLD